MNPAPSSPCRKSCSASCRAKPDALLASNTSSLKLADIAAKFKDPSRLVGIHFFNPVTRMPLVEVVAGERTSPEVAQRAAAFVRRIDKLPLPVKDAPGFPVNAVLAPYMHEAMRCVDEGIAPETIDAAMVAFGMPMGPIELADTVGLDVAVAAGRQLVGDAELADAGVIFGTGFAPYTGGPMNYLSQRLA
ncbi:MAG: 3-hydroxyacyl-CoA dehydrogenase family protein [Sulfuritalea sp.]|nr:3-hydroxyacyl-CoA dehydrogenase family protein [Sulfuritalea sp.]